MRIGEVAAATGITTKTLRFYEQAGLLTAAERMPSGYRRFAPDVVGRLKASAQHHPLNRPTG